MLKKSKTQNRDKMNKKRKISSAPKKKKAKHKRSSNEEPNDAVQVQHCSIDCRYDRKDSSAMIRCSLCMAWHHLVCVGEDDGYMGVWTCMQCRNLPLTIATLQTQMQQLVDSIAQVKSTNDHSQDEIKHLKSENGKLRVQNEQLSHQNSDLKKLIETMSDSNIATSPCSDVTANISYATVSTSDLKIPRVVLPCPRKDRRLDPPPQCLSIEVMVTEPRDRDARRGNVWRS